MFQEILYDHLFGLLVQTSEIEGDEFKLLPVRFNFREISFDPRSVFIGECISPVFSVVCSTPYVTLICVGFLHPRSYLVIQTLGGLSPTVTIDFWLGHLILLPQSLSMLLVFLIPHLIGSSWHLGDGRFRSQLLLLSSLMVSLSCLVEFFCGVSHKCPILFGQCNLFCGSRLLAVLA